MWSKVKQMDMFHPALWQRNYKEGKIAIWLLWGLSFLTLPLPLINDINRFRSHSFRRGWDFWYEFNYGTALIPLGGVIILLGCLLIGKSRSNGGAEFLFTLPFKRRDLFLAKWLLGAVHIIGVTLFNLVFMQFLVYTSVFKDHISFVYFFQFFAMMLISLLAAYSICLLVGSFTGGIIPQVLLTVAALIFPLYSVGILQEVLRIIGFEMEWLANKHWFFSDISIALVGSNSFGFSLQAPHLSSGSWAQFISLTQWVSLILYLIVGLLLGSYLWERTPCEYNGKIILFRRFEPIFLRLSVLFVALFGGIMGTGVLWNLNEQVVFFVGAITTGIITYLLLSKLMGKTLKFKK